MTFHKFRVAITLQNKWRETKFDALKKICFRSQIIERPSSLLVNTGRFMFSGFSIALKSQNIIFPFLKVLVLSSSGSYKWVHGASPTSFYPDTVLVRLHKFPTLGMRYSENDITCASPKKRCFSPKRKTVIGLAACRNKNLLD